MGLFIGNADSAPLSVIHLSLHLSLHSPLQNTEPTPVIQLQEWPSGVSKDFYRHFAITRSVIDCM